MLGILIEDSPREQLLMGVFLLLAGLVIFPWLISWMKPVVEWMNRPWSNAAWWQASYKATDGIFLFACSMFVVLGAGRLAIYSFVKAGLMASPWR